MIRRPPRSTRVRSSAASDVYKRQVGALMPQRMHICFLRCVCNLHAKLANVFPDVFPEDPSWHSCLGSMPGACLGPAFKYPGPCGGHARYQTPPDQRQWTRRRCKDPVFSSTPHLNGHYADVRDFLCYVHRGHTPQNASLQCIRSIRSFRTQDLDPVSYTHLTLPTILRV